jgi:hypothetical protein
MSSKDISAPAGTTQQIEYNTITGQVRYDARRRGYQVVIKYSSTEHQNSKMEASQRLFNSPTEAETIATAVVQDLRKHLS